MAGLLLTVFNGLYNENSSQEDLKNILGSETPPTEGPSKFI